MNLSIKDIEKLCQDYLASIYLAANSEYTGKTNKALTETSGDILYFSMSKLLSHLALSKSDIFYDLGSASGKIVAQVFLTTSVKEACGIEILASDHYLAEKISSRIQQELPDFFVGNRKLQFFLGSFLNLDFSSATVVMINSTCFSPQLTVPLGEIINKSPQIHTVLTTRPMHNLTRFKFKKAIKVNCSWDLALCYIYKSLK